MFEILNEYNGLHPVMKSLLKSIEDDNQIDKSCLCALLESSMIEPVLKFSILMDIYQSKPVYRNVIWEFLKVNHNLLIDSRVCRTISDLIKDELLYAMILTEQEVNQIFDNLIYFIAHGYSEFYPYIWHLFSRRGKASSAHSEEYRAMSYYSVVFGFDGYNDKYIKEQLKRSPSYTEGEFEVFSKVKTPVEKAYSKFGRAILSVMQDAFKHRKFNEDKFVEQLMAIPHKYKDRLHVSTLLNNGERLYYSFRRFFKEGGAYKIYNLPFENIEYETEEGDTKH